MPIRINAIKHQAASVRVTRLTATNFRNIEQLALDADPRLNVLIGPNGAGKTSILEMMAVVAKGRSFRGGRHQDLIGSHGARFQLHLDLSDDAGRQDSLGLERSAGTWRGRCNGEDLKTLSELSSALPLVVIEPNSHQLVDGSPEPRRRLLDWGVFHVKQEFLGHWQRYQRAMKQRNAQLKMSAVNQDLLDSLDQLLVSNGNHVDAARSAYITELAPAAQKMLEVLSRDLPLIDISFSPGWSGDDFAKYLARNRGRDCELGATAGGPHRADLRLSVASEKARDRLSRGQQKLLATALLLAQAQLMSEHDRAPVLLIDDLASEFDADHLARMLELLASTTAQLWLTGVDKLLIDKVKNAGLEPRVFHVKQGRVNPV